MQWHPPYRSISQPSPFRLERHREGTALQAPSHMQPSHSRLGAHSPSKHHTDTHLLIRAGKQPFSNTASSHRAGKLRHNLEKKPMVLFEPTSPGSSLSPAARARGTGTGALTGILLHCKGHWLAPLQHLRRGPGTRPAQGEGSGAVHASPGMLHKTAGLQREEPVGFAPQNQKPRQMSFRKLHTTWPHAFS